MNNTQLKEWIQNNYYLEIDSLELLREGGTVSYRLESNKKKYIVKVIPDAFSKTVKSSVDVLIHLEQYNFPSPRVITTKEGLHFINNIDENMMVIFEYIEGHDIDSNVNWIIIGELIGRLHNIMSVYSGELVHQGKEFFIDRYVHILEQKNYPSSGLLKYKVYGNDLWNRVKSLPQGYCHGDLYKGNVIKGTKNNYALLDFDTSCIGFSVYDIVILCNETDYFEFKEEDVHKSIRNYNAFLEGYQKQRSLSDIEKTAFFDLLGIYHFQLQATIIEINGLDCIDEKFIDRQFEWLMKLERFNEIHKM